MKKRPTAQDRDIADYIRSLPEGAHKITVSAEKPCRGFPRARIWEEGTFFTSSGKKRITIRNLYSGFGGKGC